MKSENSFLINYQRSIKQAMRQLSDLGEKDLFVIDEKGMLLGSLSDGDIRKWILKEGSLDASVEAICNKKHQCVDISFDPQAVKDIMLSYKIECVPVVDENRHVVKVLTWDEIFAGKVERILEQLNVPVVIMAGGKGSRLDPFTRILPKSLIPVGDKPVIEVIMDKFAQHGINDFYISVNHKARMIKSYFEDANNKYKISYVEEDKPLGTAGSLRMLQGRLTEPFIVTNCDVLINVDYAQLVRFHQEEGYDLTLVVSCRHYVIPYGVCEISDGGSLKHIKEKPELDFLINTGMYVVNNAILSLLPEGEVFNFNELILKAKAAGFRIGVFPVNEKSWMDVGQWEEYNKTVNGFQNYGA